MGFSWDINLQPINRAQGYKDPCFVLHLSYHLRSFRSFCMRENEDAPCCVSMFDGHVILHLFSFLSRRLDIHSICCQLPSCKSVDVSLDKAVRLNEPSWPPRVLGSYTIEDSKRLETRQKRKAHGLPSSESRPDVQQ